MDCTTEKRQLEFMDTTLRDGAQSEGVSFSASDKRAVYDLLTRFGIQLIEGGNPASNPKDAQFFAENKLDRLVAFGSTMRIDATAETDESLSALLSAGTKTVTLVGKSSARIAKSVLGADGEQNLKLIADSVAYLTAHGKRVIFDAEHFFDAYAENADYALATLQTAVENGADTVVLCDTNGAASPTTVYQTTKAVVERFSSIASKSSPNRTVSVGIHSHNDTGLAVAATHAAIDAGATHVQGTFLGFGERAGNANLSTVIANLMLKDEIKLPFDLTQLTSTAHKIAEIANLTLPHDMPYVGGSAFAHKAGMHGDAVQKQSDTFEHVKPETVGNTRRYLLSEISGKATLSAKLKSVMPDLKLNPDTTKRILEEVKKLEMNGYEFESADGSFVLLAERLCGNYKPSFELTSYEIIAKHPSDVCTAEVKLMAGDKTFGTKASGNGPVNALDAALRRSLAQHFPQLAEVVLVDYKVRVVDSKSATGALVRVLITSRDKTSQWTTVGVSTDIIEASKNALCDSFEYKLTGHGNVKL